MAPFEVSVSTISKLESPDLGQEFSAFGVIVSWARQAGLLKQLAQQFKLKRNKGYQGIDLILVLLAYFSGQMRRGGLNGFASGTRQLGPKLAAAGGRLRWPTQASLSRALKAVELEQAKEFGAEMLQNTVDFRPILHHTSVMEFDRLNQPWHVFDFDPTSTVIRQRALPEGDDLPDPVRLSEQLAKPGYPGRKRGEIQISRPTLSHRGSRLWLGVGLEAGNGDWEKAIEQAFMDVKRVADTHALNSERCILCIDGESGGWIQMRAGLKSPVHFITRLADYQLLKVPGRLDALHEHDWRRVEDSASGPARFAQEWGSTSEDGAKVRLVISRFKCSGKKAGAGLVVDDWQYEVFATQLGQDAFEAGDIVTLYYARCGQENYFALEDRALNLDHLFSKAPGGQLLVYIMGLWTWNIEILLGWLAQPEMPERTDSPPKREQPEDAPVKQGAADVLAVPESGRNLGSNDENHPKPTSAYHTWWTQQLYGRDGFRWDVQAGQPMCPAAQPLRFHDVRPRPNGYSEVRFRADSSACKACALRAQCTSSTRPDFRKELSFRVLTDALNTNDLDAGARPNTEAPLLEPHSRWQPPDQTPQTLGLYQPRPALLKPQELRHSFREMCLETHVEVRVKYAPRPAPQSRFMVLDRADRQRRRKPWAHRIAWNALLPDDEVTITILTLSNLARLLTPGPVPINIGLKR